MPYRHGATVQVDVAVEQLLAIEFDAVRDADVAHVAAGAGGTDRLHHRLLRADAVERGVSTDSLGQLFDAGNPFVTPLGHNIGRTKLAGDLLPRLVATHRAEPLGD